MEEYNRTYCVRPVYVSLSVAQDGSKWLTIGKLHFIWLLPCCALIVSFIAGGQVRQVIL